GRKSLIFQGILPTRVRLSDRSGRGTRSWIAGADITGCLGGGEGPSPPRYTVARPGIAVPLEVLDDNESEIRHIELRTGKFKESGELESLNIQGWNRPAEVAGEIVSSGWDGAQGRFWGLEAGSGRWGIGAGRTKRRRGGSGSRPPVSSGGSSRIRGYSSAAL